MMVLMMATYLFVQRLQHMITPQLKAAGRTITPQQNWQTTAEYKTANNQLILTHNWYISGVIQNSQQPTYTQLKHQWWNTEQTTDNLYIIDTSVVEYRTDNSQLILTRIWNISGRITATSQLILTHIWNTSQQWNHPGRGRIWPTQSPESNRSGSVGVTRQWEARLLLHDGNCVWRTDSGGSDGHNESCIDCCMTLFNTIQ